VKQDVRGVLSDKDGVVGLKAVPEDGSPGVDLGGFQIDKNAFHTFRQSPPASPAPQSADARGSLMPGLWDEKSQISGLSPSVRSVGPRDNSSPGSASLGPRADVGAPLPLVLRPDDEHQDGVSLSVRILNGVSLEEQASFAMVISESSSPAELLPALDRLCQMHVGLPTMRLQYVATSYKDGARVCERRPVDRAMAEDIRAKLVRDRREQGVQSAAAEHGFALVLCTIPMSSVQEMEVCRVRLKNIQPGAIPHDSTQRVVLKTTPLQDGHMYTVTLTNQWDSGKACFVGGQLLPDLSGVEFRLPPQMARSPQASGLYDVHLVIDHRYRAENRRALTVLDAPDDTESVISSEQSTQSFVPPPRFAGSAPGTPSGRLQSSPPSILETL
jgi:hypothetical protein